MGQVETDTAPAGLPPDSQVASRRLASGLWIMAAQVPRARQLRLVGAVAAGYLDDPPDCRGLAHLLEHGLFLGSHGWPGKGELARWVGAQGGRYNARTVEATTDVHLHLPVDAADEGVARLVDLLGWPCLDWAAVSDEVAVLEAEFRARLADPALHRLAALGQLFDPSHPAATCHAGHSATLADDRLMERLHAFHARHYRAGNMALVMLGPQSADEQLELLEQHGRRLPAKPAEKARAAPADRWRRVSPRGVVWSLPNPQRLPATSTVELLWPLPETVANTCLVPLQAIASQLNAGALTATLQQAYAVQGLKTSLTPEGTGPALCLEIAFAEQPADIAPLWASCHHALRQACQRPDPGSVPQAAVDLDDWPRQQARQLCHSPHARRQVTRACNEATKSHRHDLAGWLNPEHCRLLWQVHSDPSAPPWRQTRETATLWRPLDPAAPLPGSALPQAPAPLATRRIGSDQPHRRQYDARPLVGRLYQDARLALWWDGLEDWPAKEAHTTWCLGWPVGEGGHDARLQDWRRRTLALRQAAAVRGQRLILGSDASGDWLTAHGSPTELPLLVGQALADWQAAKTTDASTNAPLPSGLIAQQMLDRLTTRPPPRPAEAMPSLLCWARGDMGSREAQETACAFAAQLPEARSPYPAPAAIADKEQKTTWLAPRGEDRAVMLEVEGIDDSPGTRWLLQLMAQCHDAAFYREMRQRRGLGYVAVVRYRVASGWPRIGYVVQSPAASVESLRQAIRAFLRADAVRLVQLTEPKLEQLRRGLLAQQGAPETCEEAIERAWQSLRHSAHANDTRRPWRLAPWQQERAALETLTTLELSSLASALANSALPMRWWAHAPG